jgi:hypothetical protein
MLASRPDYSIQAIDNLPVEGTGTMLSFIGGLAAGDGKSQDQNPSLATVDRCDGLRRDHRAPQRDATADRTRGCSVSVVALTILLLC